MPAGQLGNSCVSLKKTFLHSSQKAFTAKFRVLVRNGADVNYTGDNGATPLHFCAK